MRVGISGSTTFENRSKIKEMIYRIKQQEDVIIVGIGDKHGADKHVRKYALEFGCDYKEANLPHTSPNLYSLMADSFYNKPYHVRNFFLRNQTFARYIDRLLIFDDTAETEKKVINLIKAANKAKKRVVVIN